MAKYKHTISLHLTWMTEPRVFEYDSLREAVLDTNSHMLTYGMLYRLRYRGLHMATHEYTVTKLVPEMKRKVQSKALCEQMFKTMHCDDDDSDFYTLSNNVWSGCRNRCCNNYPLK